MAPLPPHRCRKRWKLCWQIGSYESLSSYDFRDLLIGKFRSAAQRIGQRHLAHTQQDAGKRKANDHTHLRSSSINPRHLAVCLHSSSAQPNATYRKLAKAQVTSSIVRSMLKKIVIGFGLLILIQAIH
jgi:hypothetical protein